jgi:hypothetical protein
MSPPTLHRYITKYHENGLLYLQRMRRTPWFSIFTYYHFNPVFVVTHIGLDYTYSTPQYRLDTAHVVLHTLHFAIHQTPTFPIIFPSIATLPSFQQQRTSSQTPHTAQQTRLGAHSSLVAARLARCPCPRSLRMQSRSSGSAVGC